MIKDVYPGLDYRIRVTKSQAVSIFFAGCGQAHRLDSWAALVSDPRRKLIDGNVVSLFPDLLCVGPMLGLLT